MDQTRIRNLLRLIKMLTDKVRYYNINDIAEHLDISLRTAFRYVESFREAGFMVHRDNNGCFHLIVENPELKDISNLIHFTKEEAYIVNQLIDAIDNTNLLKQNLKKKLATVYNFTNVADSVVKRKDATNLHEIMDVLEQKKQVIFHNYSSGHGKDVTDRIVEPFAFTTNYVQVWCYDVEDKKNKLFKMSRIGVVEVLKEDWVYEKEHKQGYMDIFRVSGNEKYSIKLKLGVLSYNLLIEEYPLAEKYITSLSDNKWLLVTDVCKYFAVARFVMGLADDIEVVDTPDLKRYIKDFAKRYLINQESLL